jgi:hypothetical protein
MNANDKYFASVLFKLKVYRSDKQGYEDLFTQVMSMANSNYRNPKPQGSLGDGKCDGFDKTTGKFYQIYAPEDLKGNEQTVISKFDESLKVIIDEWNDIAPVKEFYISLNDKYKGIFHSTEKLIANLEKKFNIKCFPFLAKNLENVFNTLEEYQKFDIIGTIPNTDSLTNLISYDALKEAIEYIQNLERAYNGSKLPENINVPSKITFNKLNSFIAELINLGCYQIGNIDEYFKQNTDSKVILQKAFNNLYKQGLELIPDNDSNKNDLVFFYILENSCSSKKKVVQDAVLVLMSYYFGYCDIFEEPPKTTLF